MNNLYRLRRYLLPYASRMVAGIAAMAVVAIATVGIISLLEPILLPFPLQACGLGFLACLSLALLLPRYLGLLLLLESLHFLLH